MTILRQFIIAPSLARLIQKERGGERVLEGYFPDQPQHSTYVQIEEARSSLILEAMEGDEIPEEQADLPPAHAQALLAVSEGQVEYVRTKLSISSHEIQARHFVRPVALDLVAIAGVPEDGQDLPPLPWFGPEVSTEPAYQRRRLALDGAPDAPEVDATNAALNSLLDLLEDRFTTWPVQGQAEEPGAPAADVSLASDAPVPAPETEADEEIDDLGIEDAVIRELARSLQPRRGG
jgi:CYTH domain-containing protein